MRNTARSQVIALAVFGALAWVSVDVAELRSAAADFLFPRQIERSVPAHEFDVPALGEEMDAIDRRPNGSEVEPLNIVPADHIWVSPQPPQLVAG